MMWEHHNSGVVESTGMAWDNGAPIWPFKTLGILAGPANLRRAADWLVTCPIVSERR